MTKTISPFSQLKNQSTNLEDAAKKYKDASAGGSKKNYDDNRFWTYALDKAGNGSATIRFLPATNGEDVPFISYYTHSFNEGPKKYFIEMCPTSIGLKCPVCDANNKLWDSKEDQKIAKARERKRRLVYVSNIYIVTDPVNPENEGKVFLWKYGKKIHDKLMEACAPQFEDETPINPFDFWKGANLKLKIRKVDGQVNYDKSTFDTPTALSTDDSTLEKVWNSQHKLQEFIAVNAFKTYEDLKKRFDFVTGSNADYGNAAEEEVEQVVETKQVSKTTQPKVTSKVQDAVVEEVEDDTLEAYKKLLLQD